MSAVRANHQDILDDIRAKQVTSDETDAKLKLAIETYANKNCIYCKVSSYIFLFIDFLTAS